MSSPTDFLSTISTPPSSAFAATTSPSSKPPSTDSQSCLAQLSSPAPIGTTLPPTKLPLMDPDPTPVQTEEKSFFVPKHRFGFSLPSDQGSRSKKRHFGISLPSDQGSRPSKRVKKLLTTVSAKREKDVEDLHALRMLQLARASREAFAASTKYRLTRIHELNVMRTIAHDEYEEAVALLKSADYQIGELRRFLAANGTGIVSLSSLNLSPVPATGYSDAESSVDGASHDRSVPQSPLDV